MRHQNFVCVCVSVRVCMCVCVCMYKMLTFSIKTWSKINVEVIKYNHKKWINEKLSEVALGYKDLVGNKTQYYSDEFKERRCEIQDCEDFQPCRKFIAEELAIHLIIDIKTVKAAELKIKLGFNQVDPIMSKQESIGLKLKKTFLGEEIIEDSVKENKRQTKIAKYLDCKFIRINPDKKDFSAYDELGEI